jgi:hypothetical protein
MNRDSTAVNDAAIITAESVTKLEARHRGAVLVAGSHGGIYAAYVAARGGVRAVILNDAGVGLDGAGIASLPYLEAIGMAAATVSHRSARIGSGDDMMARGTISHCNRLAARNGVQTGQTCAHAAEALRHAVMPHSDVPDYVESRFCVREAPPQAWALDSASLVSATDASHILLIGSHGGLLGGRPEAALKYDAVAAVFNDAGVGIEDAGIARIFALDARKISAVTVDCRTARIGDGRSTYETGILSHVNVTAAARGAKPGLRAAEFVALIATSAKL